MSEVVYMVTASAGSYDSVLEHEAFVSVSFDKAMGYYDFLSTKIKEARDIVGANPHPGAKLPEDFAAPKFFHDIVDYALFDNDMVTLAVFRLPLETPLAAGRQLVTRAVLSLEKYPTDTLWDADDADIIDTPVVPYEDIEAHVLGER